MGKDRFFEHQSQFQANMIFKYACPVLDQKGHKTVDSGPPWGIKLKALLSFFFRVKEACILLNLLPGSAVLLRDLLKSSESNASEGEFISPACAALQDAGVYRLTLDDALKVLSLRVHLPSV